MANNIALAKTFVPILDEIYKLASLTSKLDGAAELARQGANANELIVPMLSMQGLGDYSRNDGKTSGEEAGGYKKATGAKNINFMVFHPSALIQFQKHTVPKIKGPEDDLDGDRHMFGYRTVGIADVYANKLAGIYLHRKKRWRI